MCLIVARLENAPRDRSDLYYDTERIWNPEILATVAQSTTLFAAGETCERHCARTRKLFGCVVNGGGPAIAEFSSVPSDPELIDAKCRCLRVELLCDRKRHCINGSDEWPLTCVKWNASTECGKSEFKCSSRQAISPSIGRRPFCIPKTALCDYHQDCIDGSDERNCSFKGTEHVVFELINLCKYFDL